MNIGGGEAADQLVRMMLSGSEVAVRLSGSAIKNVLALTMALAKKHKTISGKVNLAKMLKETRDARADAVNGTAWAVVGGRQRLGADDLSVLHKIAPSARLVAPVAACGKHLFALFKVLVHHVFHSVQRRDLARRLGIHIDRVPLFRVLAVELHMQRHTVHPTHNVHRGVKIIAELEVDLTVTHRRVQTDRHVRRR